MVLSGFISVVVGHANEKVQAEARMHNNLPVLWLCIGVVTSCTDVAQANYGQAGADKKPVVLRVCPLTPTIRTGDKGSVLIVLPAISQDLKTWKVYFGADGDGIASGKLTDVPSSQLVEIVPDSPGMYNCVLVLQDASGQPQLVDLAQIDAVTSWRQNWWDKVMGPVIGAAIAVIVFLIQGTLSGIISRWKQIGRIDAQLWQAVDGLREGVESNDKSVLVPRWIVDPMEAGWSRDFCSPLYRKRIRSIRDEHRKWTRGLIPKDEVLVEYGNIQARLRRGLLSHALALLLL